MHVNTHRKTHFSLFQTALIHVGSSSAQTQVKREKKAREGGEEGEKEGQGGQTEIKSAQLCCPLLTQHGCSLSLHIHTTWLKEHRVTKQTGIRNTDTH